MEYYRFIADNEYRRRFFINDETDDNRRKHRAELIAKICCLLMSLFFSKELNDKARNILSKYSVGKLLVSGDNRYLSDDLIRFVAHIVKQTVGESFHTVSLKKSF